MNHLLKRNGYYYFRLKVPVDIQPYLSSIEIKKSLKTSDIGNAKTLIKSLAHKADKLFTLIRGNMVTSEQIVKLTQDYFGNGLC